MKTSNQNIISNVILDYSYSNPLKVDKRKRATKEAFKIGFNEQQIVNARLIHIKRIKSRLNQVQPISFERKIMFLKEVKESTFDLNANSSRHNMTGIDWRAYHRPSSNGKGWVLIAPDEPANNWYIEDAVVLKLLTKKYLN